MRFHVVLLEFIDEVNSNRKGAPIWRHHPSW
jgi:hypothetical protein